MFLDLTRYFFQIQPFAFCLFQEARIKYLPFIFESLQNILFGFLEPFPNFNEVLFRMNPRNGGCSR